MKICSTCLMDETAIEIEFFDDNTCNFCRGYYETSDKDLHLSADDQIRFDKYMSSLAKNSSSKKYDCLIGVSGGVDSSYVAYLAKVKYGLNPLAIHLDNGWNSELAVSNIESIMNKMGIDLITHVLNWHEFREIQKSFLFSGISNIEIPTDHAIWSLLLKTAKKYNIKVIFAGNNVVNESIMPNSWLYGSKDSTLIKDIYKKYSNKNLKYYPYLTKFDYFKYLVFYKIKWFPILNYIDFDKNEAKEFLIKNYSWKDYGGKHYESVFTRFFHEDFIVEKFGFDLRKSYLSAEICSGKITREQGLQELSLPVDDSAILQNRKYVFKKLGISLNEYEKIISSKNKTYNDYKNDDGIWKKYSKIISVLRDFITKI